MKYDTIAIGGSGSLHYEPTGEHGAKAAVGEREKN